MRKIILLLVSCLWICAFAATAQIVTSYPPILQEDSKDIVLTYHADSPMGNNGLANLPQSTKVYAHIGVITSKSVSTSDWKYVVADWPASDGSTSQTSNLPKNTLTYVSPNTYELKIGDIRSYFGIKDASEHIQKIALVFRDANGSRQGKTAAGGDIFVDVHPSGFAMNLVTDATSTVISKETTMTFTVNASTAADLSISVNGTVIAEAKGTALLSKSYTFSGIGTYNVVGTAVYGGKTYTETINVAWPQPSTAADYPGGVPVMGAVKGADGSVTFCLAAPGKTSVVLVPSWDDYEVLSANTMNYQDYNGARYFWITVKGLDNDKYYPYYYLVDGVYSVADPYAHLVLDCYSDKWINADVWPDMPKYPYEKFDGIMLAVYRGDLDDYKWSPFEIPDHDNLVIYEMLLRDFTGTDGEANGNGTVRQAIERIPYIKSLGVNAVELMPIMEFNGNSSWGYNTNFYMAPDKAYGSPTDYKDFIDECHRNGIAVILDIVFNQSDGLHPWYQMYPIKQNPFYNETAPHQYSVLNDWNQGYPLVDRQWDDAVRYWMEKYNVDGFRFDLVKGLGDNDSYSNGTDGYNASRIARMKRIHSVIKSVKPKGIHINEDLAQAQEEIELGNDGQLQWANINYNSCQFTMGYGESAGSGALTTCFLSTRQDNRPWGSTVAYAESHDEERMAFKNNSYGIAAVKNNRETSFKRLGSLAATMLMTPGPKMIWQFGELGDDQNTKNSGGNNTDPKIVDWYLLNDANSAALLDIYSQLCWLRQKNPDLFSREATFAATGLGSAMSVNRTLRLTTADKEVIAFINSNTGGSSRTISTSATLLSPTNSYLVCATPGFDAKLNASGKNVSVTAPAHSFAIFATNSTTGVGDIVADGATSAIVMGGYGEIIITGEYESAAVYDLTGRMMPSLSVPAGVYIVNVDGTTSKVVVK